jgi:hypothetical protein
MPFNLITIKGKKGENMKKVFSILLSLAILTSVAIAPVYAAGGKNHGDVGQGTVDQGEIGGETGNAPGANCD